MEFGNCFALMHGVFPKTKETRVEEAMSIPKKSLISTLKTAKKANVAAAGAHEADVKGEKIASMRVPTAKVAVTAKSGFSARAVGSSKASLRSFKGNTLKSARANTFKAAQ